MDLNPMYKFSLSIKVKLIFEAKQFFSFTENLLILNVINET